MMLASSTRALARARATLGASRVLVVRSAAFVGGPENVKNPKAAVKPAAPKAVKAAKVQRAPTAFNLFYKVQYPALKTANPEVKLPEANKELRAKWDALPEADKAPFLKEAAAKKAVVDATRVRAAGYAQNPVLRRLAACTQKRRPDHKGGGN